MIPVLPVNPPMVGRGGEIKKLQNLFDSTIKGVGATVLISGEAGLGKTRLVNEFLDGARRKGAKVLSGWCLSEGSIPYFPFIEAFNSQQSLSPAHDQSNIAKQLGISGWLKGPGASSTKSGGFVFSPEVERDRTFESVSNALLQASSSSPIILFIDDLHWADHLSLAMLHYLSRKSRSSHLLVVGTYRPEELQAEEGKTHPLQDTLFSMSREDLFTKIDLTPLSMGSTTELVSSTLKSPVDEKLVEKIYTEAEGNPLFTLETLRLLIEEGQLVEKRGRWVLTTDIDKVMIPSKVLDVINRRITRLGREDKKLLSVASVCGYTFDGGLVSSTVNSELTDVLQTLSEVEEKHKLIRTENSHFAFTHHKIREAIYSAIPSELRKAYHIKAAGVLEKSVDPTTRDTEIASIAMHYVEGGVPEKAFNYLLTLGEKAVNIYANVQAIDFLTKALDATRKDKTLATDENLGKIYGLRGRALVGQGLAPKAVEDLKLSLDHYSIVGNDSILAETNYFLGNAFSIAGEVIGSMHYLNEALAISRRIGNRNVECRCIYDLSWPLLRSTDTIDKVHEGLKESTRICEEVDDKVLQSHNEFWVGILHNFSGEFTEATEHLEKAVAISGETGEAFYNLFSSFILGMAQAGRGHFDDAVNTLQKTRKTAEDNGIEYFIPRTLNALGWIHYELYDFDQAIQYNKAALETAKAQIALPPSLLNLGFNYLSTGDYQTSKSYFDEAKSVLHLHQCVQWRYELKSMYGLGSVALAQSDYPEALRLAEAALNISHKAGAKKHITKCLKLKAEALDRMGRTGEASENMREAAELAERIGYPPLIWESHHGLGLILKEHGDKKEASQYFNKALKTLEETASSISNPQLQNALLTSQEIKALRKLN